MDGCVIEQTQVIPLKSWFQRLDECDVFGHQLLKGEKMEEARYASD